MRAYFVFSLAFLFFLSVKVEQIWAQELSPDPSRTGLPATGEGVVVSEPAVDLSNTLYFTNNPVSEFLALYEKLKGVTLIKDAALASTNLSLICNQPVTTAEMIRLIESTLLLNGYAFIALDKNAVKVINAAGKSPRSEGVKMYFDKSDLPEGEVVASYVMTLDYLPAADAIPIFEKFITLHPYGSLVSVPLANQVLITESSTLIRRLIEVKKLIDTPAPLRKNEFIQLVQANADRVVELIMQ